MKNPLRVTQLLALIFLAYTCPAEALNVSVKASASISVLAGLDPPTRALIASLPDDVRAKALELLTAALPLIDDSVEKYLDRVNEIVDVQIDHISCSLVGVGKASVDEVKALFNTAPTPIANLEKQALQLQTAFKADSPPKQYRVAYAELLVNGAKTACSAMSVQQALSLINDLRAASSYQGRLWTRAETYSCKNASDCLSAIVARTEEAIKNADIRDITTVQGDVRIKKINMPAKPGFFKSFRQAPYEDRMDELFSIQDGIALAHDVRLSIARQNMNMGQGKIDAMDAANKLAKTNLSQTLVSSNNSAIGVVSTVPEMAIDAQVFLDKAVETDSSLRAAQLTLSSQINNLKASAESIVTTALNNNKAIATAQNEQAAKEALATQQAIKDAQVKHDQKIESAINKSTHGCKGATCGP